MHAPATLEAYVSLSWLTSFHSSAIEKGWSPGMRAILNCFGRKNRITVRLAYSVTRGLREGGGFKIVGETGEIKLYRLELRNRPEAI
ncbi:hypothetical protein ACVWZK_008170 [Bradyrhizobium sp. GM0.4]